MKPRTACRTLLAMAACCAFSAAAAPPHDALRLTGVNIAGADFAGNKIPGVAGRDYFYPSPKTIGHFAGEGMNAVRMPFLWERLQPALNGDFDAAELRRLSAAVANATGKGLYVVLDVHNYAAYRQKVIGSSEVPVSAFGDLWRRLAGEFKSNPKVGFGLMNEPKGLPAESWLQAANAAIAEIRRAGATNLIFVPGNSWTGAHSWFGNGRGTSNAVAMLGVNDPGNHYVYEVHQYLDSNYSGTHPDCKSTNVGVRALAPFTEWLRQHHQRGFLGEFGAGSDPTCLAALDAMLTFIDANRDVWLGWTYWAAGPWSPKYFTSIQPVDGKEAPQTAVLLKHLAHARQGRTQ